MKIKRIILGITILMLINTITPKTQTTSEQISELPKIIATEVQAVEQIEEIKNEYQEPTETSEQGISFIKSKEGLILTSKKYKGEKYYTIGYGHCQKEVKANQTITEEQATEILRQDLKYFEQIVASKCDYLNLTQSQFDALVSFTYNLGQGNLNKLIDNGNRDIETIAEKIINYTNSGNESNRKGLELRRTQEQEMILKGI